MLPPYIVSAHIRRSFVLALAVYAVVKSMGYKQIYSPYRQIIDKPFYIRACKIPGHAVSAAYAKALVKVPAPAQIAGGVGRALCLNGIHAHCVPLFGRNPPEHQILPRHLEVLLQLNVVTAVGMPHKRNIVTGAPVGQLFVKNLTFSFQYLLMVYGCGGIFHSCEQALQITDAATLLGNYFIKACSPWLDGRVAAPSQYAWFICKKAYNGSSEILSHCLVVSFISQLYKPVYRQRIENICGKRGIGLPVILTKVYAADSAAAAHLCKIAAVI